jgi:uncharacterized protein YcgI (DUF1989 family)
MQLQPGNATVVDLKSGEWLTLTSPEGGQGGDLYFPGFDQALTRNANGWARHEKPWMVLWVDEGMHLFDVDREPVLEIGPSRGPGHVDVTLPGCWSEIYPDKRPGCQELISGALGLEPRDVIGMVSFFVAGPVEDGVYKTFSVPAEVSPGDFVSFKAVKDVRVAVSACPDDEVMGWRPAPIDVEVTADGPAGADR